MQHANAMLKRTDQKHIVVLLCLNNIYSWPHEHQSKSSHDQESVILE